ncbi:MAG: GntR family transcriptional regulator [Gammaproteobacteria bacterium]|jgi:DNA-binding GntR family transcriptional regulator|uniref:GntR family transcriptional regulator n=1 Tax=Marinomonas TaxID=28253 RepID=UPI000C1E14B1|nr:GntR family transcriptional regulator [Marinomonas sp. BSi20584]MBU1294852.1 GntR family transcriptional regulator [Gammaproteobacteria bacterium]MBU1468252.1 GntR family transcriptional regulator [Gammaproteobacteria bacterium]MBU2023765.1 GntR family transcriptional regulator [Gammaproteobacteria bacterium]MBU2236673.1 GntR family transcriptional regulator [Gammaproteobacteria bacterium]MBU2318931.1 GntR family transcriptional regulator [Gammaproteobacteria bacterium]|tara:strand:+ start:12738 stop:13361 length:624 start_codon:yes stop_codon:yes gene_type:complete
MDVSQSIKEDILKNQLPRGVPLRQAILSTRYGVSRIPIRDALLSLKSEGWLVPNGKAGVMIPDLNWTEAEDLYLMRAELECLLFSMAFDYISEEDLIKARHFLTELNKENLTLVYKGELNWLFHHTLYRAAERPTLQRVVEGLNKQAVRYLGFQYGPLGYKVRSQNQHEELLLLIESNDKNAALIFLRQHIENAGILLTEFLKKLNT